MYDRFTATARSAVARSEAEAFARGASQVEPEDVLVALAGHDGVAGNVLRAVAADAAVLRAGTATTNGPASTDAARPRPLALSHATAAAFSIAAREADGLRLAWLGTEHLLLGLLREPTGRATALLLAVRRDPARVREGILDLISGPGFVSPEAPRAEAPDVDRPVSNGAIDAVRTDMVVPASEASEAELLRTLVLEVRRVRSELTTLTTEVAALRAELGHLAPRNGRHIA